MIVFFKAYGSILQFDCKDVKRMSLTSSPASEILRIVYGYTIASRFISHVAFITVLNIVSTSLPQHTPLHIAVKEFQMHTVEALVFNKADINSQDKDGVITLLQCR